jgi:hypothetical protein
VSSQETRQTAGCSLGRTRTTVTGLRHEPVVHRLSTAARRPTSKPGSAPWQTRREPLHPRGNFEPTVDPTKSCPSITQFSGDVKPTPQGGRRGTKWPMTTAGFGSQAASARDVRPEYPPQMASNRTARALQKKRRQAAALPKGPSKVPRNLSRRQPCHQPDAPGPARSPA